MNCNEARRMITAYVKKELSEKDLEAFLNHISHCSDCMDELDTYYTVYQALDLLDSGDHHSYDFRHMLKEDIRAAWRRLHRRKALGVVCAIGLLLTECLLAVSAYTGYEIRQGQEEYTTIQRALLRMRTPGLLFEEPELAAGQKGHKEAVFEMPDTEVDDLQISAGPEPLLKTGAEDGAETAPHETGTPAQGE